nr:prolipoprotein diacylglyceryl transferase [Mycolicibacterium malmesburyense]CRL71951.1 prolipoprotein diacylglyceryl transferase [Mycolicibacterium malmesburyense]
MTTTVLAAIPSPAQGVWHLGPVPIRAYAVCIIVGIVAALIIGDRRWEARGGERGVIYDIALWAVPFGLIGGRLYHVATDWWRYFGDNGAGLAGVFRIWDGGLGIWGAVALGGVGAWIACRRRGIPLPAFADAIAPGIILAQGIGRLGNYFNQELWGADTTLPWALEIYERRDSAGMIDNLNGVSTGEVVQLVHPTFLYELLWNLLVFAVLIYADRRFKLGHGRLFALYVAGYCVGRFWIELLRADDATLIEGVRINSFTATFVFIGAVVYIMAAPKGREDPAALRGKAEPERPRVEDLTEELAAVASTSGVFAAAKAAAAEDDASEAETVKAEALTADVPEDEAISAEDVSAEDLGADVAGVPAEDLEEAEEFAAEGDEEPESDVEAVAEAEALAEDVEEAPAAEIAEAEEFAEAGAADEAGEGGVGAVEGEEASDALVDAAEAHESAVEGEAAAEELVEKTATPAVVAPAPKARRGLRLWPKRRRKPDAGGAAAVAAGAPEAEAVSEAEELAEDVAEAPSEEIVEAEEFAEAGEAADAGGVGAVEGEEASDALVDAAEAHEAAVEGEAAAEELADEAEAEAEGAEAEAAPKADEHTEVGGVGAVEGAEADAALADAPEAHEAAVEGEAAAEELADEAEAEAEEAEAVAEEEQPEEAETAATDDDETADAEEESHEPVDVGGVGVVEGEEADAALADAPEAHEAAVEGETAAEELADEAEADADESEADDDETVDAVAKSDEPADAGGVGAVEGEEADAAIADGPEAHEAAVEGETSAEKVADDLGTTPETGGRVRNWLRRRRNR